MEVFTAFGEFVDRLFSNWWRFGWATAIALIFGATAWSFVRKIAVIPAALGAFWLTWLVYNAVKSGKVVLFESIPNLSRMFSDIGDRALVFVGFILALSLAVLTILFSAKNDDNERANIFLRIGMGFMTFLGLMLLWRPLLAIFVALGKAATGLV